jgi:phosphoheptose isomerase
MAIKYYGNKGDGIVVISSSGKSKNMINACTAARKKNSQNNYINWTFGK